MAKTKVESFLASYPPETQALALHARTFLVRGLPGVAEAVDLPARMIGYSYGPGYRGMVCTLNSPNRRPPPGLISSTCPSLMDISPSPRISCKLNPCGDAGQSRSNFAVPVPRLMTSA